MVRPDTREQFQKHVVTQYTAGRLLSEMSPLRFYPFSLGVVRLRRMTFQFERVPKAEIYSTKLEKGINMGKVQKVYTKEFKEEAVRLVETSGKPITQIARELGISDSAIHSWRKELAKHGAEAFPGKGHQTALEEENCSLEERIRASTTGA